MTSVVMSQSTPVVFVVDDDLFVRESLEGLIRFEGWLPITFGSALDFLAHPRVLAPNCAVLDVSLPDLNGLDLQERIARERHDMPIIFITGLGDVPMTVRAMKAGAQDFLIKPVKTDELVTAIRAALELSCVALSREMKCEALKECYGALSGRQRQVFSLVVSGLSNKQVGNELSITEGTVKTHRGRVMEKMKADSFPDLVKMAWLVLGCEPSFESAMESRDIE